MSFDEQNYATSDTIQILESRQSNVREFTQLCTQTYMLVTIYYLYVHVFITIMLVKVTDTFKRY